jgi:hypothetical protein
VLPPSGTLEGPDHSGPLFESGLSASTVSADDTAVRLIMVAVHVIEVDIVRTSRVTESVGIRVPIVTD